MTPEAQAALVLERLLIDPEFRAGFRVAPAATLERHGLPEMARRMRNDARAVQTLEIRESRSSLAGVMMAAAVEGVALFHAVSRQARPLDDEAAAAMRRALERPVVRRLTSVMPAAHAAPPAIPAPPGSDPPGAMPVTPDAASAPATPDADGAPADTPPASNPAEAMPVITTAAPRTGVVATARPDRPQEPAHEHPDADADAANHAADDGVVPYPGDNASKAAIAQWMGAAAKRAGLPPELPVMAALQESGLRNLKGGDADSAGYFQMRASIWGQGAYRGYRDNPDLQLKWFIDQALRDKAAHPRLAVSAHDYGEWIADVEHPLAAYRGLYQPHLGEARDLLHQAAPRAHAAEAAADAHDGDTAAALPQRILAVAAQELGVTEHPPGSNDGARIAQYRTAGPDAGVGPWCAYFVSWVAKRAGVPLDGHGFASVDALWAWARQSGHAVHTPKPGDLIVWDEHVGIVERIDADGTLHTIEGNTSDQVARRVHTAAGVVGYVRLT